MVGKTAIKDDYFKNTKTYSSNKNYNLKNKLLKEKKIDNDFLEKIKLLKLEEIITLKLIVSTSLLKGKLFNFPFLKYSTEICKEAVLRFALSQAKSKKEALLILGMKRADLSYYLKKYNLEKDF
jgi:transcriptional regulator with AAA-type ATPase domain